VTALREEIAQLQARIATKDKQMEDLKSMVQMSCSLERAGAGVPKRVKVQMGSREDFALFDGEQRPWPGHMPHGQGHKESHQWKKKATGGAVEKSGCCQLAGIVTDVLLQPIV